MARKSLLEAVKMIKIKTDEADFGLHSSRIGALTAAANSGKWVIYRVIDKYRVIILIQVENTG